MLGSIDIDGHQLTAETRSRERAERLKDIIQTQLADHATFRIDKIQTVEQMLADAHDQPPAPAPQNAPESQALITDFLRKHYTAWIDTALPMLDNRTPRHVVQTPDGRKQVQALLQDAESHAVGLSSAARKPIFDDIRQQLGLMD